MELVLIFSKKILVGHECSGRLRDVLRAMGHDAISCDLKQTERPGPHMQCDVFEAAHSQKWDAAMFFPDCTFLCSSGLHHNKNNHDRAKKTEAALDHVVNLLNLDIHAIGIENPIGCISTRIKCNNGVYSKVDIGEIIPKSQIIPKQVLQPYDFGDDASKATCIFKKNLKNIKKNPAIRVPGRITEWPKGSGKIVERWDNQTDSGQNRLTPSEGRAAERSRTYWGIALALGKLFI